MRRMIFILSIGLLFTNCTHRIVRTGYQIKKSDYKNCDVVIKKDIYVPDSFANKVGEIKLGESGFSVACSEEHAINILKSEACSIEADLILITEENRPNFWSTCYRCRAAFFRYNSTDILDDMGDNETFSPDEVKNRVSQDRLKNTGIAIGSVAVGFVIALLIF